MSSDSHLPILNEAFKNYVSIAEEIIRNDKYRSNENIIHLVRTDADKIYSIAASTINSDAFSMLVKATIDTFSPLPFETSYKFLLTGEEHWRDFPFPDDGGHSGFFTMAIFNYFCRSGMYRNLYNNDNVNIDRLLNNYRNSFTKLTMEVRYYLPLDGIRLESEDTDFGDFKIIRYNSQHFKELDEINSIGFGKYIRPNSYHDDRLHNMWFLETKETIPITLQTSSDDDDDYFDKRLSAFISTNSGYSKILERALLPIFLFPWIENDKETDSEAILLPESGASRADSTAKQEQIPFKSPIEPLFIFECHDHLIDYPTGYRIHKSIPDKLRQSGRLLEILFLNENHSNTFIEFIHHTKKLLDAVYEEITKLNFVKVALGFYVKAFASNITNWERLLWFITSIEALIGEKSSVADNVSRRLALIMGSSPGKRAEIKREFKNLYNMRSRIIHGEIIPEKDIIIHVNKVGYYCQALLIWYLNFVNHLIEISALNMIKERKELLDIIDIGGDVELPRDFPYHKEWFGTRYSGISRARRYFPL